MEIMIWYNIHKNWDNNNHNVSKQLFGSNIMGSPKQMQKQLKELFKEIPELKDCFFIPKSSIKRYLITKYLNHKRYEKPVLCLIICHIEKYGEPFHAIVARINRTANKRKRKI